MNTETKNDDEEPREKKGSKRHTRFVLDPFQIFCLENRPIFVRRYPHYKIYEITSVLASVWRSLPEAQRNHYHVMALKLKNNTCCTKRKGRGKDNTDRTGNQEERTEKVTEIIEIKDQDQYSRFGECDFPIIWYNQAYIEEE